METWQMIAVYMIAWGFIGVYVAAQKNRAMLEGFALGMVGGPIGALIVACLPQGETSADVSAKRRAIWDQQGRDEDAAKERAQRESAARVKALRSGR
jgi:hypothetical protein